MKEKITEALSKVIALAKQVSPFLLGVLVGYLGRSVISLALSLLVKLVG